jgi:predicted small lipoprotein YifL
VKTFLLIGFLFITLNLIGCGQKGDLVRPQHASEQSAEPQNVQDVQNEANEQDEQDKN